MQAQSTWKDLYILFLPLAVTFLSVCMVSYACGYICVYICAARLYKKHNPHAKLPCGILASSIIFPYPRNKGENGSKKVSTASKSSSRSKGKSHEVTYPQMPKTQQKKTPPCLFCGLVPSLTKATKQPLQTWRSSLQSGRQKKRHC